MKALRFHAPEDVRLEDVPEPECKSDEIKIKVRNCSTCGTDVNAQTNYGLLLKATNFKVSQQLQK